MTAPAPRPHPVDLPAWHRLTTLAQAPQPHLRELLVSEPDRTQRLTLQAAGITLDATRQRLTPEVEAALVDLAVQADLPGQRDAMFRGEAINTTEQRPVLHVALRGGGATADAPHPWPAEVSESVARELDRMTGFAEQLRAGQIKGSSGQAYTDVVNIGIGGSDLGPRMATEALAHLAHPAVRVHYLANPDAWALWSVLRTLDAQRTLFIVASKTFTTQETLANAATARRWLRDQGIPEDGLHQHLVAVTAAPDEAARHGHPPERTFLFSDWVGGRYSLWSALGLPLAVAIGRDAFLQLLAGARAMDQHFLQAPPARNLPMRLALHGVWNRNFLAMPSLMLAAYTARLGRFTPYVQQMDMESNGKHTHLDGVPVTVDTGPVIWGGLGMDGQHAFYQLIHQGRHKVAVDFIGVRTDDTPLPLAADHLALVNRNLLAQAEAMARGRSLEDTLAMLHRLGMPEAEAQALAPHRQFHGNTPSHIFWLEQLDPSSLGALAALFEHRVFCQAALWNINAYDQWGVELGKTLAKAMEQGR